MINLRKRRTNEEEPEPISIPEIDRIPQKLQRQYIVYAIKGPYTVTDSLFLVVPRSQFPELSIATFSPENSEPEELRSCIVEAIENALVRPELGKLFEVNDLDPDEEEAVFRVLNAEDVRMNAYKYIGTHN